MRYFIDLAYNGKNYHGWQKQPDAISIQEVVENAFFTMLQKKIAIVGAGRTDAGVHAKQLLAHFDVDEALDTSLFQYKLNSFLPKDISVQEIYLVKRNVHARFDATGREYEYVISLKKDPFAKEFSHLLYRKPDIELMNEAAAVLLNYENFQCFSKTKTDVKTYNCDVKKAYWREENSQLIFTISADRFLRNMVRAIVGSLLEVGYKKKTIQDFHELIKSRNRRNAGTSAPAKGLFLIHVEYPADIKL